MAHQHLHDSIVVSIPACHAGDRGSIPRRGVFFFRRHANFKCSFQGVQAALKVPLTKF